MLLPQYITNTAEYAFPNANQSYLVLRKNPFRCGLTIVNNNAAGNIFWSTNQGDTISGIQLAPSEKFYSDSVTTQDAIYIYAQNANATANVQEMSYENQYDTALGKFVP
jgi:hypothetical protein